MDDVTFILSTVPLFLVMFSTCTCSQAGKNKFHYLLKSPKLLCSITSFLALNIKKKTKTRSSPSNGAQNVGTVIVLVNSNECIVNGLNIFCPEILTVVTNCPKEIKILNALILKSTSRSQGAIYFPHFGQSSKGFVSKWRWSCPLQQSTSVQTLSQQILINTEIRDALVQPVHTRYKYRVPFLVAY